MPGVMTLDASCVPWGIGEIPVRCCNSSLVTAGLRVLSALGVPQGRLLGSVNWWLFLSFWPFIS